MNLSPINVKFHNKKKTEDKGIFAVDNDGKISMICRIHKSDIELTKTDEDTVTKKITNLKNRLNARKTVAISLVTELEFNAELGKVMLSNGISKVRDEAQLKTQFREIKQLYLLDGHHRLEAYKALDKEYVDVTIYNEEDILMF